jgi:hypothetical protein
MSHYKASRDWETNELVWTDLRSGERFWAPILYSSVKELRLMQQIKFKKLCRLSLFRSLLQVHG